MVGKRWVSEKVWDVRVWSCIATLDTEGRLGSCAAAGLLQDKRGDGIWESGFECIFS